MVLDGLVSVIVPAYNAERFIGEALDSAFAQDYRSIEVIVVDDGSTDRTAEIASAYDVRLLRQPNGGPAAARNAGLAVARGEYIGILDADDIWPADRLSVLVGALERSGAGIARGQLELFVTPGDPVPSHLPTGTQRPVGDHHAALFARRSLYDLVGNFDERLRIGEDTDWFLRARDVGATFVSVERVMTRYRFHANNTTRDRAASRAAMLQLLHGSAKRRRRGRRVRVGVVITAYNYEGFVGAAIESLLEQTHPATEIVVLDDGSTDRTAAVAKRYEPSVRIVTVEHGGIGAARNRGQAELGDVDAVAFLDADDLLPPDSIERRALVLALRDDIDIVFGHEQRFERVQGGQPMEVGAPRPAHVPAAMLVRWPALQRVGPFATDVRVAEGLDWLLRAGELGLRTATVPERV